MKVRAFARLVTLVALMVSLLAAGSVAANLDSMCSDIPASECNALIAFYNATGGATWNTRTNWLTDSHVCFHWYGVQCWNGHVFRLDLRQNGLTGAIPTALTGLPYLDTLYLWGNQLHGPIPPELGSLTQLRWLGLSENPLGGQIPSSFGNLRALEDLSLASCGLSGPIPDALGNLTNLKRLRLWGNQLAGFIPATFENLKNLQELSLEQNQMNGPLPAFLGTLSALQDLGLSSNHFDETIPATLGDLTNLTSLNLGGNDLTGPIPSTLGNLTNLTELSLWGNELTDAIPPALGALSELAVLNLFDNNLSGHIPTELGNLSHLEEFYAGSNELDGPIPDSLGNLIALRVLRLPDNQLSDAIPSSLGELGNLTELSLFGNKRGGRSGLLGPIPASLGSLVNLQVLNLSGNSLTHEIPHSLFQLPELTTLQLSDNLLEGDLPAPGAAMTDDASGAAVASKLVVVDVSYNRLTGIKLNWGAGTPVKSVNLRGNLIQQGIPAALFKIPTLEFIDLGDNKLEGHIPDVAALVNLKILKLDHNNLTGGIPINIDALHNLEVLNLSYNSFDRTLDLPSTSALSKLSYLDLSHNKLWWAIPPEIGLLTGLKMLRLNDNRLGEKIPSELGKLKGLEELDLSRNEFTGGFPACIGELTDLKHLAMREINSPGLGLGLGGQLPPTFGALTNLQYLDLHGLYIEGPLPAGMANMTSLTHLDLGNNFFEGNVPGGFSRLTKMQYLDMSGTPRLSGLPLTNVVKMTQLRYCNLSIGPVTRGNPIPSDIGDLKNLQLLWLDGNGITGQIPIRLGELKSLADLNLGGNPLEGAIPKQLGALSALKSLWVSETQLTSVPAELGNLSNLEDLNMGMNPLLAVSDSSWLGRLTKLKTLNLSGDDRFGGSISWLGNLTNLETAEMANCKFTGTLPSLIGFTKLKVLEMVNNRLTGLPDKIGPAGLEMLDISDNRLTGKIPRVLALWGLKVLRLHNDVVGGGNSLSGDLPATICSLGLLEELNIKNNSWDLEGPVPRCLMDMPHLRFLQFYNTGLCEWGDVSFQWFLVRMDPMGFMRVTNERCDKPSTSAQIGPSGGTLSSEGDNTTYSFAPGTFGGTVAVASTAVVTVTHVPKDAGNAPATGTLVGIRHFYDAYARDASGQYVQPVKPYTVTIQYGPLDLVSNRAMESTLALYRWNGTSWVRELTSRVDVVSDTITANPTRFSTWAVLGEKAPSRRRLPIVMRGNME